MCKFPAGGPLKPCICIGNWKLHQTLAQTRDFFAEWRRQNVPAQLVVGFAVPYTAIDTAARAVQDLSVEIGAQDCADRRQGAFTGEVSAEMVREAGAQFVILGHSERRRFFHETDAVIREKVQLAQQAGLKIVLCCGETAEERDQGRGGEVLQEQVRGAVEQFQSTELLIAYEPVWAIGTGNAASPELIEETLVGLSAWLTGIYPVVPPLLYGGSVTPETVGGIVARPHVQGVLVGGPSTDPVLFARLCQAAAAALR